MSRQAQASLEYLALLAFTLAILVPAIYLFYTYSTASKEQFSDSQVQAIGNKIIENVRFVYYSGEGSKITLEINMPAGLERIYIIENRELVFELSQDIGTNEMIFFSDISMDTSLCDPDIKICYVATEPISGKIKLLIQALSGNKVRLSIV